MVVGKRLGSKIAEGAVPRLCRRGRRVLLLLLVMVLLLLLVVVVVVVVMKM